MAKGNGRRKDFEGLIEELTTATKEQNKLLSKEERAEEARHRDDRNFNIRSQLDKNWGLVQTFYGRAEVKKSEEIIRQTTNIADLEREDRIKEAGEHKTLIESLKSMGQAQQEANEGIIQSNEIIGQSVGLYDRQSAVLNDFMKSFSSFSDDKTSAKKKEKDNEDRRRWAKLIDGIKGLKSGFENFTKGFKDSFLGKKLATGAGWLMKMAKIGLAIAGVLGFIAFVDSPAWKKMIGWLKTDVVPVLEKTFEEFKELVTSINTWMIESGAYKAIGNTIVAALRGLNALMHDINALIGRETDPRTGEKHTWYSVLKDHWVTLGLLIALFVGPGRTIKGLMWIIGISWVAFRKNILGITTASEAAAAEAKAASKEASALSRAWAGLKTWTKTLRERFKLPGLGEPTRMPGDPPRTRLGFFERILVRVRSFSLSLSKLFTVPVIKVGEGLTGATKMFADILTASKAYALKIGGKFSVPKIDVGKGLTGATNMFARILAAASKYADKIKERYKVPDLPKKVPAGTPGGTGATNMFARILSQSQVYARGLADSFKAPATKRIWIEQYTQQRGGKTVTISGHFKRQPMAGPQSIFESLRIHIGNFNRSMEVKIGGWSKGLMESKAITGLKNTYNLLKAPFVRVGEFLTGKKSPGLLPGERPGLKTGLPGGLGRITTGFNNFFVSLGEGIKKMPGYELIKNWGGKGVTGTVKALPVIGNAVAFIVAYYDAIEQWGSDKGFEEGGYFNMPKPKDLNEKIGASVLRGVTEFIGFFGDLPTHFVGWFLKKFGFGTVSRTGYRGDPGRVVSKPWMKELENMHIAGILFAFTFGAFRIFSNIVSVISSLLTDPVGTMKNFFNDQWYKDNIWDSGGDGKPTRFFGVSIPWPQDLFAGKPLTGDMIWDVMPDFMKDPFAWFINLINPFNTAAKRLASRTDADIARMEAEAEIMRLEGTQRALNRSAIGDWKMQFQRAAGIPLSEILSIKDIAGMDVTNNSVALGWQKRIVGFEDQKKSLLEQIAVQQKILADQVVPNGSLLTHDTGLHRLIKEGNDLWKNSQLMQQTYMGDPRGRGVTIINNNTTIAPSNATSTSVKVEAGTGVRDPYTNAQRANGY